MNIPKIWVWGFFAALIMCCGPVDIEYNSKLTQLSQFEYDVKVALLGIDNGNVRLIISTRKESSDFQICSLSDESLCLDRQGMNFLRKSDDRFIYSLAGSLKSAASFQFLVRDGESNIRKFRIISIVQPSQNKWKMVLMTGDNEFDAWDNAREKLHSIFSGRGVKSESIAQLSMKPNKQVPGKILPSSRENLQLALQNLNPKNDENCFVFLTSHGSRQGFFLRNKGTITPDQFDSILTSTCGNRPTVALISACYSGVMITSKSQKPNRIILTAASSSKTSFGCDARSTYTFFDQCVIESLPKARLWKNFAEINRKCVYDLEKKRSTSHHSEPQVFIGENVKELAMP